MIEYAAYALVPTRAFLLALGLVAWFQIVYKTVHGQRVDPREFLGWAIITTLFALIMGWLS